MHPKAESIQRQLRELGLPAQVRELADETRSAEQAAAALGVERAQIVKSLIFLSGDELILVLVSGDHRVDVAKLVRWVQPKPRPATPAEVSALTGFEVGGVAPIGYRRRPRAFMDEDLLEHDYVYASGGTPHAIFGLPPLELARITGAEAVDLKA